MVVGARRTERLAALCEALGDAASYVRCDVTKRADLEALVAHAVDRYGALDGLVNNAGIARLGRIEEAQVDAWDAMIDVNLRGVLHGIAAAMPVFRERGRGHIVNVVSTSGLRIVPTQGVYAATKNAVRTLSEALRQEAGPNLRVTVVSPGFVKTELVDGGVDAVPDPDVRAALRRRVADVAIEPEAIARAIAFALEQPPEVDVGDIVVRPTAQD